VANDIEVRLGDVVKMFGDVAAVDQTRRRRSRYPIASPS
jgi:hypothetical protein